MICSVTSIVHIFLLFARKTTSAPVFPASSPRPSNPQTPAVCMYVLSIFGRATAQAVSFWLLTAEARVRPQVNTVGFVVDNVGLGQVFLRVLLVFPCQYHPTAVLY
jgi:hypothetical protein